MNNVADDLHNAYSDGFADGYKQGMKDAQPETMYYPQVNGVTPSVIIQPERKKGKWDTALRDDPLIKTSDCICSICGGRTFGTPNFCPNCGADMRQI